MNPVIERRRGVTHSIPGLPHGRALREFALSAPTCATRPLQPGDLVKRWSRVLIVVSVAHDSCRAVPIRVAHVVDTYRPRKHASPRCSAALRRINARSRGAASRTDAPS